MINPDLIERGAEAFSYCIQGVEVTNIITKEQIAETILTAAIGQPIVDLDELTCEINEELTWRKLVKEGHCEYHDDVPEHIWEAALAYRALFAGGEND